MLTKFEMLPIVKKHMTLFFLVIENVYAYLDNMLQ